MLPIAIESTRTLALQMQAFDGMLWEIDHLAHERICLSMAGNQQGREGNEVGAQFHVCCTVLQPRPSCARLLASPDSTPITVTPPHRQLKALAMLEAQPALATDRLHIIVEQADLAAKRRLTAASKMARAREVSDEHRQEGSEPSAGSGCSTAPKGGAIQLNHFYPQRGSKPT